MKTKLEMAHDYLRDIVSNWEYDDSFNPVDEAWKLADAMQAEADKRDEEKVSQKRKAIREMLNGDNTFLEKEGQHFDDVEWQPDWSQAPEWANWWVIGSLTKQGIWSESKPNSVKINGADYWEVTSPIGDEHLSVAPSFSYKGDWRDSLRKRPN